MQSTNQTLRTVVRSSYADAFYARLAREAIADWKDAELWGDTYHEYAQTLITLAPRPRDHTEALFL